MLLKKPMTIKNLTLHNRLVLPPMASANCPDGSVTQQLLDHYEDICRGGHIGLVITEHAYIHPQGKASVTQMSIADDDCIPGLRRLVEVIHRWGSKAICQINHAGSGTNPDITGGWAPIGPSAVAHPKKSDNVPREISADQLAAMPALFADAARRAVAAGFDGVEIHSAHGYFLNQFYSPMTNHRTDAYGGSLENRVRLHLEVIRAVRQAVGAQFPIALRLGGCDYMDGGSTIDDAVAACRLFVQAGVDLIDITGGMCSYTVPGRDWPGWFRDQTQAVKAALDVPVILTGGIVTAGQAETLLQEGAADCIGVGRAILRDHRWAEKELG